MSTPSLGGVSLESAGVVCTVPVTNGADTADVVIALTWTTTGDIFTEIINNPGMHAQHRTTFATVGGGVTITGTDGVLMGKVGGVVGGGALADARITRFNETQIGGP